MTNICWSSISVEFLATRFRFVTMVELWTPSSNHNHIIILLLSFSFCFIVAFFFFHCLVRKGGALFLEAKKWIFLCIFSLCSVKIYYWNCKGLTDKNLFDFLFTIRIQIQAIFNTYNNLKKKISCGLVFLFIHVPWSK